jgi:hypothetical protein
VSAIGGRQGRLESERQPESARRFDPETTLNKKISAGLMMGTNVFTKPD